MDLKGGKLRPLTRHKDNEFFHTWAPDGKSIAFSSDRTGNRDIWRLDLESGDEIQLTKHKADDDDPCFSPDGKTIAFDSGREGPQAIFVMDADGKNVRRVSRGTAFVQVPTFSPSGRMICFEALNPNGRRRTRTPCRLGQRWTRRCRSPAQARRRAGVPAAMRSSSPSGGDGAEQIYRVPAPTSIEQRERVPFLGTIEVDRRTELAELFDEAWTKLGRAFYDKKMHGVNWLEMRKKYRDMAIDAENKEAFQAVVSQMLAELNASHLGIGGGRKASNAVDVKIVGTGYLGMTLAEDVANGGRTIMDVLPNGPAAKARLRVGDVVTEVNKVKLAKKGANLDRALRGMVQKRVLLLFKPITSDGLGDESTVELEATSQGVVRGLRHARWVRASTKKVKERSKGRAAYIHLQAMNQRNLMKFSQHDRRAQPLEARQGTRHRRPRERWRQHSPAALADPLRQALREDQVAHAPRPRPCSRRSTGASPSRC